MTEDEKDNVDMKTEAQHIRELIDLVFTNMVYNKQCYLEFEKEEKKEKHCKERTTELIDNLFKEIKAEYEKGEYVFVNINVIESIIENDIWEAVRNEEEINIDELVKKKRREIFLRDV